MGPLETTGERTELSLTGMSLACLVGTPIGQSEPLPEDLLHLELTLGVVNLSESFC